MNPSNESNLIEKLIHDVKENPKPNYLQVLLSILVVKNPDDDCYKELLFDMEKKYNLTPVLP